MYQPTDYDLQILKLLHESQPLTESEIVNKLPDIEAIPLRLQDLSCRPPCAIPGTIFSAPEKGCYIYPETGQYWGNSTKYVITPLGKRALQESVYAKRKERLEIWLRNAWIPILVSVATNLILAALRQLWPLILQWASSILSATP